ERYFITFNNDRQVTGNLEKAFQTLESWARAYPRPAPQPPDPVELLSGISTRGTGRLELAVEHAKKTIEIYPDAPIGYGALAGSTIVLGRLDDAENALKQAATRNVDQANFPALRYAIAFLRGDEEQMGRAAAAAKGRPGAERMVVNLESLV